MGGDISNVTSSFATRSGDRRDKRRFAYDATIHRQANYASGVTDVARRGISGLADGCLRDDFLLMQRAVFVCGLVTAGKRDKRFDERYARLLLQDDGRQGTDWLEGFAKRDKPGGMRIISACDFIAERDLVQLSAQVGLRVVLMHELAHIKRGDLWVNLLQTLLQIVYFYNPLLWLANWAIRRVREQAVDETVQVALGDKAQQYPETLLNVARLAFERPALSLRLIGVVESKGALTGRIKRMLNRPIPKTAKLGIIGSVAVILLAAILLPMAKAAKTGGTGD